MVDSDHILYDPHFIKADAEAQLAGFVEMAAEERRGAPSKPRLAHLVERNPKADAVARAAVRWLKAIEDGAYPGRVDTETALVRAVDRYLKERR